MTAKLRIIIRACQIRIDNGEELDEILKSYPALSEEEIAEIKNYCANKDS